MINIKSNDEIEKIREAGIISANFFKYIAKFIQSGIATKELDKLAENFHFKKQCSAFI